jgi:hypothetical protein
MQDKHAFDKAQLNGKTIWLGSDEMLWTLSAKDADALFSIK